MNRLGKLCIGLVLVTPLAALADKPKATKTENVLFVMLDGVRWQEVFTGAEESLLNADRGGVSNVDDIKQRFWRETPEERRAALFPFLWEVISKEGQIYGNGPRSSVARVTNMLNFSYPGYNEVLCGYPDFGVNSNDKIYNRNRTVLEWLNEKPEFNGKIAAFTSWDVFPFIINEPRSGIPVNAGFMPIGNVDPNPEIDLLNKLIVETPLYGEHTRFDAFTFRAAMAYLKVKQPRILYISFDETDAQGHAGRYDRLLVSANKLDGFIRELWETVQQMPQYQGKTTLVVTTDHGRGDPPVDWKSHSASILGSQYIWMAFLGPDTPALGERHDIKPVTQSQIAATIASLLGEDYEAAQPKAGKTIPEVLADR